MKFYSFRPHSLVTTHIHAEWKALLDQLKRESGPKHIALWCAIPPGVWNMHDISIGPPFLLGSHS